MFDILTFLEKYATVVGGPTGKGEVFLDECITYGKPKKHKASFAVNIHKPVWHCYRCGASGKWPYLMSKLARISLQEAKWLMGETLDLRPEKKEEKGELQPCDLPPISPWTPRATNYLAGRGIKNSAINHFCLYYCSIGRFQQRIIIPVVFNGMVVSFQARSIFPDHEIRYDSPYNAPKGRIWYNLEDYKGGEVHIVEGPLDVINLWQYGIYAICPFGKNISDEQIKILLDKGAKNVILMHDSDAIGEIQKTWARLNRSFDVTVKPLMTGDPGSLKKEEAHAVVSVNLAYEARVMAFNNWKEKVMGGR